jgi:hypothetical protein
MANNNMKFNISFNVDRSGLNTIKSELASISKLGRESLFKMGGTKEAISSLEDVKRVAQQLDQVLEDAFNPQLNTIDMNKFNQTINNSLGGIQNV